MPPRPELSSLLVAHKLATGRQIERAARARDENEIPLWSALLEGEVLSGEALFALLRDHSQFPVVSESALASTPPREMLAAILSEEEALAWGILVLGLSGDSKRVQLAMIDPTDSARLRKLAAAAGFSSAKVFLVERSTLVAAVEQAYLERAPVSRAIVEPAGKVGERSELEVAERLERVLVEASLALGAALEAELVRGGTGASTFPHEAARLARELARELNHDRRRVALAGLAAMMVQLDVLRRSVQGEDEPTLFDELGWAAAGDDGLLSVAGALSSQRAGFGRVAVSSPTQRIVQAVTDYLALASADGTLGPSGLDATEQLLRTSIAGAPTIDALLRVLRRDLVERTPAQANELPEAANEPSVVTVVRAAGRPRVPSATAARGAPEDRTQLVVLPAGSARDEPSQDG